jgi:hypothetical protein
MKIKDVILEKAPPEAKFKRMAKHIKAGYKGSGLDKDEIAQRAFGATWKAHNKEKGVSEQQSGNNYTADEMVAILSGQKTQAQVDAERKAKAAQTSTSQAPQRRPQTPTKEAAGDKMGQVTSVTPAGDVKIKTPSGTEITTKKDALLPGAQPGTVQMKPDATDNALKPGTQVVSTESLEDGFAPIRADELKASIMNEIPPEHKADVDKMVVSKPDGTVDYHRTLSNMAGQMFYNMDELLEMFIDWSKEAGSYIGSAEFKDLPPTQQQAWKELATWGPKLEQTRQELTKSAGEYDKESNQLYAQKMGTAMPEDQQADNVTSPISGAEDHDEITKLMVQRIRKLAGL